MRIAVSRGAAWLRRRAENVAAGLLAAMFVAFVIQIVFRYAFNWPIGWTTEVCIIAWLWVILWTSAFVLKESEELCFDLVTAAVGARLRRRLKAAGALGLAILFAVSLPGAVDYVAFMKVEKTAYMGVRFDYLFAIYVVFAAAVVARYGWAAWRDLRGKADDGATPPPDGAAG